MSLDSQKETEDAINGFPLTAYSSDSSSQSGSDGEEETNHRLSVNTLTTRTVNTAAEKPTGFAMTMKSTLAAKSSQGLSQILPQQSSQRHFEGPSQEPCRPVVGSAVPKVAKVVPIKLAVGIQVCLF